MYKIDRYFTESCCVAKKLSLVLCDDREVWRGVERLKREMIYAYTRLIHFLVQQKPTEHCKAITLQFLKIERKNKTILLAKGFLVVWLVLLSTIC